MSLLNDKVIFEGLTFDDVSLRAQYSDILPAETSVKSRFSRNIEVQENLHEK